MRPSARTLRGLTSPALILLLASPVLAQPPQLIAPTGPLSPADERKAFTVPAGFEVQLVAAEPDIQKPIQMAFDARGRLWVTTSYHYPFAAAGKATDKLFVLSDFGPDGKAGKVQVFAADLNIPIGILPLPDCNSCIVSSVGEILKLTDTDGDGKADKREVLFTGFGSKDTHGMYNSFTLMPDGWVYACHGFSNESRVKGKDGHEVVMQSGHTFRFRPDGSRIEVFTRGQVNPFGMAVDPWLNLYTADCHSKPITQLIPGAYYDSFGKPHDGLGYAPHVTRHDHGSTALCGLTYYHADHFPKEYRHTMFLGNVVTNRINFDRIDWKGSTPVAVEQPDFLVSKDPWFRPTDIKLGPDGALYVADFYNKIIGHYEVDLKHPARDKDRGRVWRIVYKESPRMPRADWAKATDTELLKDIAGPNLTVRMLAGNELVRRARGGKTPDFDTGVALELAGNPETASLVMGWMAFIAEADQKPVPVQNYADVVKHAKDFDPKLKPEQFTGLVIRAMATRKDWGDAERAVALDCLKSFNAPRLTRAIVEGVAAHPHPDFVRPLVEVIQKCPAADDHLKHAARIALRNCLRDSLDVKAWQEAESLPAEAAPLVADVALGIPNAAAAAYLAGIIKAGRAADDRVPAYAEHIGRHGGVRDRIPFIEALKLQKDRAKVTAALTAFVRGSQARGGFARPEEAEFAFAFIRTGLTGGPAEARIALLNLLGEVRAVAPQFQFREHTHCDPLPYITLMLRDARESEALRAAALDALMKIDAPSAIVTAEKLIDDPKTTLPMREKAAVVLAGSADRNHKLAAKDAIKAVPYRSAVVIATALAASKPGGEVLLTAVKQGQASARLLQEKAVLERLKAVGIPDLDKQVAELTKGLPPADRKIAALIQQRAGKFDGFAPDKELGAKLFTKHCGACHRIGDVGGKVGPQLDGIGSRGVERLLEDVLDPNRNVDAAFRARTLNLADGRTLTGLLMLRVEGEVVVFADSEGKEVRIPSKEIEKNTETTLSPMPGNFGDVIPETDFLHLMAYLLDQRAKDPPKKKD